MNRRDAIAGLIAGTAATLAVSVSASQAATADAELIALCRQFDENEKRYLSYFEGGANEIEDDDERGIITDPISDQQRALADQIVGHRIRTMQGFSAVARSLRLWQPEITDPAECTYISEKFAAMMARDAEGLA